MIYSNLYTCWYQNDMDISDSDNIVNSVTVVNALLLTIPFNLLGAYNETFWAWEINNIATCNNGIYNATSGIFTPSFLNDLGLDLYLNVSSKIFNCTFAAVIGLFLAAIYYTLRPKNQAIFAQWWPRGNCYFNLNFYLYSNDKFVVFVRDVCWPCVIIQSIQLLC